MGGSAVQIGIPGAIPDGLTIFETMRADPDGRIALWPLHRARLQAGCAAVGFLLRPSAIRGALATIPKGRTMRVRLTVAADGAVALSHGRVPPNPPLWRVAIAAQRLDSGDPWLRIKSSRRETYDAARTALPDGVDEAILLNERGEVCEGSITSLFLRRGDRLLTPPLRSGVLPGVLRRSLLDGGRAVETLLYPRDLAEGEIVMGNALRGLIPARLAEG